MWYLIAIAGLSVMSCMAGLQPDQVVNLYTTDTKSDRDDRLASLTDFVTWKLGSTTFREIALYKTEPYEVSERGFQGQVQGYSVWVSIFDVLGIKPLLGRTFLPEEKEPGQSKVVILCYEFWQSAFDGNPAILGKAKLVDGEQRTVVGVMPRSMDSLGTGRILTPFVPAWVAGDSHDREYHVIAALRTGLKLAEAQAELDSLDQKRHRDEPKYPSSLKALVAPMKHL